MVQTSQLIWPAGILLPFGKIGLLTESECLT